MGKRTKEEEKEFIRIFLQNNPDFSGWMLDDYSGSWFYIKADKDKRLPSKEIIEIDNTLYAFNENGKAIDSFVSFSTYRDEKDRLVYLFNNYIDDIAELSLNDCLLLDDTHYYFNGRQGLAKNVVLKLILNDGFEYEFVTNLKGKPYSELVLGKKLCIKGFIANVHMFQSPYKTFGTVVINGIPFLVSDTGTILNTEKCRYKEDKIYAYVNTDKTFFYSVYPNDSKWY